MTRIERIKRNLYQFKSPVNQVATKATADHLFTQGFAAEQRGDMNDALELYQRSLSYDPCASGALINLGTILFNLRNFAGAEESYRKAIEIDPEYAMAHFDLANVLDEKGAFQEAAEHFLEAIKINPQYVDAHYNLAGVYDHLGECRLALKHYRLYLQYQDNDFPYQGIAQREIRRLQERDLVIMPKPTVTDTSIAQSKHKTALR